MKTILLTAVMACILTNTGLVFAQGSLTPPGAPAPTMKSLAQIEPRTPISSLPYTITNGGSYYLTANLTGSGGSHGVTIASGNVTLDLNGFALLGVPGSLNGVSVAGAYTNLTVRNGSVTGWGGHGVAGDSVGSSRNLVFERLTVSANGADGIATGPASVVRDCLSQSNRFDGIVSSGDLISGCVVRDSGGYGIIAYSCVVRDCQVQSCGNFGIYIAPGTVSGCRVESSAQNGIFVAAPGCQILGNTCIGNNTLNNTNYAGIYINASNNRVEDNHVTASGALGAGIRVIGGFGYTNNVIIKNSVAGNGTNNYSITTNQVVGPLITTTGTITNSNPWANFSF